MKAKDILQKYNITRMTLYRWVKEGKISFDILPSGRYDYHDHISKYEKLEQNNRKNIIYARVSSTTQKNNLQPQVDRIKSFASSKGFVIDEVYSEIASALNYNRKKYRQLFKEIKENKIDTVFIEYKDRLLRIGFEDFQEFCNLHKTNVVVIDNSINLNEEISEDLICLVNQLPTELYSEKQIKQIISLIKQ